MQLLNKELYSAAAIVLTFIALIPYIRNILINNIKPHVFSWVIWATTTFIVFLAQLEDGAGVGAWPVGLSALLTTAVAALAYSKRADISITKIDWAFFLTALSSIPLWFIMQDPLWTVVILTIIDVLGFGPTIRKTYHDPYAESSLFFIIFITRNILVILALENYSITTILFPAAIAIACVMLVALLVTRRYLIKAQ